MTTEPERCVECERLPVKSRRNTRCMSCGAIVCERCQDRHFMRHEREEDELYLGRVGRRRRP